MSDSTKYSTKLSKSQIGFYALPALPLSLPTLALYINLPTWYHEQWGLSLGLIALILFFARVSDLLVDPFIGRLNDRLSDTTQRSVIIAGGLICIPSALLLIYPAESYTAISLSLGLIGLFFGWTLIQIPYLSWLVRLSSDAQERITIASFREFLGLIGLLLSALIPALMVYLGYSSTEALRAIVWIALLLGSITLTLLMAKVRLKPLNRKEDSQTDSASTWRPIQRNRLAKRLAISWFFNGLANGVPATLFPLYITMVLLLPESDRTLYIAIYFLSCILSIPVWIKLTRTLDRIDLWRTGMLISAVVFVPASMLGSDTAWLFIPICLLTGAMLGADLAIPHAIQADVADYHQWRFGQSQTNLLFALWNMITKLALALSATLAFGLLELFGQTPLVLALIYALIPSVLKIIAVLVVRDFRLSASTHKKIKQRLAQETIR
ncbi:Inner membrane symporter YicJ [Marinobacterium sp. xm-a-121]|jgi:Na+/melibiose symporter-like transporter|uniref:MFS transporter n=1 Tax=unclassified Marinobacterium TaxID=2644139 RepID=UPI00156A5865|nr:MULTISPECIES: MFS transporter [unclassified Marinobacterium]NRP38185.1 Inner membrane symporter YicJ [Marinobacterium sp. xm-a-121]NRP46968.1 Inner membrane symporter YicJ [Marinobacterium sp. xm-d-543]NRP53106.1 Inner membrane symporter YicJ [Marinobacterium sp. xm-v-242]NRP78265.1 Inner membrane symporter YicJ [Marinobacterium sp. xm-m-383]NRP98799.1 Inner membrane symporter YicJ [Marinobacterium sp. xm-v-233]